MAKRNASELIGTLRTMLGDTVPDGLENFLGDITDSVGEIDTTNFIEKSAYDTAIAERDNYKKQYDDVRSSYINRFYQGYAAPNDRGIIYGETPQEKIEEEEKKISYDDLFE